MRSASSSSLFASSSAPLCPSASSSVGVWRRKEAKVARTETLDGWQHNARLHTKEEETEGRLTNVKEM